MIRRCCNTCRHFDSSTHSGLADDGGLCRHKSPVADDRSGLARWPTVQHDDWCGDYVVSDNAVDDDAIDDDIPF